MAPVSSIANTAAAARLRTGADGLTHGLAPLTVDARRVANTVAQGLHGRRKPGMGDSFWEFRPYRPGDPIRSIDWRRTARGDQVYVRETEWDAAQSLWLWADQSPTMHYKSAPGSARGQALANAQSQHHTKSERAQLLGLALSILLVEGGERVALLDREEPPRSGRSTLDRLALHLTDTAGNDASLPPFRRLPRHAHTVLFSDFLSPLDQIAERIIALQSPGVGGDLVQILDPAEAAFPFKGRIRFEEMTGSASALIRRSEDIRSAFLERLQEHQAGLAALARRLGWRFMVHVTDRPASAALLDLMVTLENRAPETQRGAG